MTPVDILGVRVDDATYEDLLAQVDAFVASGRPHQVITVNPEMLVAAHQDSALRLVLNQSDLNVPDGVGLLWAARWLGKPLRQRVTGSDGIYNLSAYCAKKGYRLFFLGAAPGVADQASLRLAALNPGLKVAGTYAGSPHASDAGETIAQVRRATPDLLFVAYGVPSEEEWIARHRERLGVPVMVGVGGAFDFVAGIARRAPPWMRRAGLEWLYRLIREPWRWRRQLALPHFVVLVARQKLAARRRADGSATAGDPPGAGR